MRIAPIEIPYAKPSTLDHALLTADSVERKIITAEYNRRPWKRYWQHNGILHTDRHCQPGATLAPQYSGLPETDLGHVHACQRKTCDGSGSTPTDTYHNQGSCPHCGKHITVKKNGTLRKH